ncbi:unnamed protein product [Nippostrongylus brasiliensis]|uniref:Secreted protein n=1 Tax=Nippostrongylus brasiliensis TaxID=27835 RepID=A0A0N4XXI5_NIPBR|nr:unnamed protein product [Nippostrongylus brasiliensis]
MQFWLRLTLVCCFVVLLLATNHQQDKRPALLSRYGRAVLSRYGKRSPGVVAPDNDLWYTTVDRSAKDRQLIQIVPESHTSSLRRDRTAVVPKRKWRVHVHTVHGRVEEVTESKTSCRNRISSTAIVVVVIIHV